MPDTELAPEEFGRKGLTVSYAGHYLFVDNVPRPMHKHRGAELVLFTRGRCATKTETGATFECTPETLLVIPPGMKHIQYDNSADCETYYAVFEDADGTADLSLRLLDLHGEPMLQRWLTDLFELCSRHEFGPASALLTAAWGHLESFEAARGRGLLHPVLAKALPVMLDRFDEDFSMTDLALKFSRYVNGVSRKHAEVSRAMFNDPSIDWVTNGVHSTTWTSPGFAKLYDANIPGWRNDPSRLMQAQHIPADEIWKAHQAAKMKLLALVLEETGQELSPDVLTIGFARRAATYKRADLVFSDIKKLLEIGSGKLQFIFSGKAHPHDEPGKDILQKIWKISKEVGKTMPVVFIENYNMGSAKLITSGVDLWLNTPVRPREASGTSGMKCVHNGVMNFSVLDGWWIEGCEEGLTGWAIGPQPTEADMNGYNEAEDAADLYSKLQNKIIPTYYGDRECWIRMMKFAITYNASYFNTHRVVKEYCEKAYGTVFRGH